MKLIEWLYSSYPNQEPGAGPWGILHIVVLVLCASFIIGSTLFLKSKNEKQKRVLLWVLSGIIIVFEIARRVIDIKAEVEKIREQVQNIE